MAKGKQVFFCQECGFESTKWMGQCPGCNAWNSFCEEKVTVGAMSQSGRRAVVAPTSILEVETTDETRFTTGIGELNRVLGGGIVSGSLVLVGGDPGIGKSTILLQMCRNMSEMGQKILYVSGEESLSQNKDEGRAYRKFYKGYAASLCQQSRGCGGVCQEGHSKGHCYRVHTDHSYG